MVTRAHLLPLLHASPPRPPPEALLADVEVLMAELAGPNRAGQMAREHLDTGGKRLRAQLALEVSHALGCCAQEAVPWAAAVELLHNATLVHDDVQDGDTERRGHPTTWARHGTAQAINVGDLLLMLPFLAIARLPRGVARAGLSEDLARAACDVVRGQALELDLLPERRFDADSYRTAVRGKTGALLALPSNIGRFNRDRFSVVPEGEINVGYLVTPHLRAFIGYDILYWNNVARPGGQIDRNLDVTQIPNFLQAGAGAPGKTQPSAPRDSTDIWVQGVTFGLEFRF